MNALTQSLENMPAEPSTNRLRRLASDDYVRNLPEDFWSPVFGQARTRDAYNFSFELWQTHYQDRKAAMQRFFENWLRQGGTILESFSDNRPTADFTEAYHNGCPDTLWSVKGTRRMDIHGNISDYQRPFIDPNMTPEYLAEHLACRMFGFNLRVATWLEIPQPIKPRCLTSTSANPISTKAPAYAHTMTIAVPSLTRPPVWNVATRNWQHKAQPGNTTITCPSAMPIQDFEE